MEGLTVLYQKRKVALWHTLPALLLIFAVINLLIFNIKTALRLKKTISNHNHSIGSKVMSKTTAIPHHKQDIFKLWSRRKEVSDWAISCITE